MSKEVGKSLFWRLPSAFASWDHTQEFYTNQSEVQMGLCANVLLLLLSRFCRVRLCATPEMAGHQAPLSLAFSRQEHWSGLPFPSPMQESEKWKVKVKSLSCVWLFANVLVLNKRRRKKKVHYIPFPYVTWIFSAFIVDVLQLSLVVSIIVCWVAVEYFETSLWIQMLLFCQSETLKSFCFIIIKRLIYLYIYKENFRISTFSMHYVLWKKIKLVFLI